MKFFHNYTDWNYQGFLCYKSFINQFAYSQCSASSALSIKINQNNKKSKTKKQINKQTNKEKSKQKTKQKQKSYIHGITISQMKEYFEVPEASFHVPQPYPLINKKSWPYELSGWTLAKCVFHGIYIIAVPSS